MLQAIDMNVVCGPVLRLLLICVYLLQLLQVIFYFERRHVEAQSVLKFPFL